MTNEEKAIIEYPKKQASDVNEQKRQIFVKACEWKDEQFKEYLENERKHYEKKYNLLKNNEFNQTEADKAWRIYHYLDAIINELFKED